MVPREDRPAEVVEPLGTAVASITLALGLGVILSILDHLDGAAFGAIEPTGPTHRPDGLEALGIVDEALEVDHRELGP